MEQRTRELLDALHEADWFSAVGQPVPEPLQEEVIVVSSWAEAVERCGSASWESFTLKQRNLLTIYLYEHARDGYRRWNDIVDEVKTSLLPLVERKLGPVVERHGLPEVVGHCVWWDVLGACMEGEYADVRPPGFFTDLTGWYIRGRFPCGWGRIDGDAKVRLAGMDAEDEPGGHDNLTRVLNFPLLEPPIWLPEGRLIIF